MSKAKTAAHSSVMLMYTNARKNEASMPGSFSVGCCSAALSTRESTSAQVLPLKLGCCAYETTATGSACARSHSSSSLHTAP
eukprot:scaffold78186_cov61-Phaeocystis_antarctica.AAC.1